MRKKELLFLAMQTAVHQRSATGTDVLAFSPATAGSLLSCEIDGFTEAGTLRGVGNATAEGYEIPLRIHGGQKMNGTELIAAATRHSTVPTVTSLGDLSFLGGEAELPLLDRSDLRFLPKTSYTVKFSFTAEEAISPPVSAGLLAVYADGTREALPPKNASIGMTAGETREVHFLSAKEKDLIGLSLSVGDGIRRTLKKESVSIYRGTSLTGGTATAVTLRVPISAPLHRIAAEGKCDSLDPIAGRLTRRLFLFRPAGMTPMLTDTPGVFSLSLPKEVLAAHVYLARGFRIAATLGALASQSDSAFAASDGRTLYFSLGETCRTKEEATAELEEKDPALLFVLKNEETESITPLTLSYPAAYAELEILTDPAPAKAHITFG